MRISTVIAEQLLSMGVQAMGASEKEVYVPSVGVLIVVEGDVISYDCNRIFTPARGQAMVHREWYLPIELYGHGLAHVCADMIASCDPLM
jgi:hypothetical protein